MNAFDIVAGLVRVLSILAGWMRGGAREVSGAAVLVLAAAGSLFALRYSAPIARQAIHTDWLAEAAALLVVFAALYVILALVVGALARSLERSDGLGGFDRLLGASVGAVRALVLLGLANLALNAVTPAARMPHWISGAKLYPVTAVSARALTLFAPQGEKLARQVAPVMDKALAAGDARGDVAADSQNRDYSGAPKGALGVRVEKAP
ncbi:MAG: CvpA family protein [Caulobacteraceae bacterium]